MYKKNKSTKLYFNQISVTTDYKLIEKLLSLTKTSTIIYYECLSKMQRNPRLTDGEAIYNMLLVEIDVTLFTSNRYLKSKAIKELTSIGFWERVKPYKSNVYKINIDYINPFTPNQEATYRLNGWLSGQPKLTS